MVIYLLRIDNLCASPIIINYLWNIGFLLGITIILQIITGIFLVIIFGYAFCMEFPWGKKHGHR